MRRILLRRWLIVWAIGGSILGTIAGRTRGDEPVEPGTLSGRVVDGEGKGVAGAKVGASFTYVGVSGKRTTFEVRTDAEGRFRTGPLDPVYRMPGLVVDAAGFARWTSPSSAFAVHPGADLDVGTIRLDRGRVVVGRVVEADGTPRAAAEVSVQVSRHYQGHTIGYASPRQALQTDADGRFRAGPLPSGSLGVTVRAAERVIPVMPRRTLLPGPGPEEDLGTIRLEPDTPFTATVRDEAGRPVAGAAIGGTIGISARTDADGRFTLRGLGAEFSLWVTARQPGYQVLQGQLTVDARGGHFGEVGPDVRPSAAAALPVGPERVRDLTLTLRRAGTIDGVAVDAATGRPIRLLSLTDWIVGRRPDGEATLTPERSGPEFLAEGRFRVTYMVPGEHRLLLSAEGYRDAEVFVPTGAELTAVRGIIARLVPKDDRPAPAAARTITGRVTRDGRPVGVGWVALWAPRKPGMAPDAAVLRGRTVVDPASVLAASPIADGAYALDLPAERDQATLTAERYLVVAEPGQPPTQVGPIALREGEAKALDVACTAGGQVRGTVADVPADWRGHAYVVAFNRSGVRAEARVESDGSFALPPLPPGEYGLKAGHDAYEDAETYPGLLAQEHPEAYQQVADPWRRAVRVTVESGKDVGGVAVAWPE